MRSARLWGVAPILPLLLWYLVLKIRPWPYAPNRPRAYVLVERAGIRCGGSWRRVLCYLGAAWWPLPCLLDLLSGKSCPPPPKGLQVQAATPDCNLLLPHCSVGTM